VEIRPYRPEDAVAVREVHLKAFEGREEEPRLVDLLHAAGAAPISLVAAEEPGGRILGHVLFSPVDLDEPPAALHLLGLAPVGVLPEEQGRGIGSRLIRAGLAACLAAGYDAVVVLGEPDYYSRFGFQRASDRGFGNEYGADEPFMVADLREGALGGAGGAGGTVRYRPEFREIGA
jgi:putative acetyltransferase